MEDELIIEDEKKSQATRIKNVMVKYKGWRKARYETTNFQDPVLFFIRRSGETEIYENATSGNFNYIHSDGSRRFINIIPSKQLKMGFADRKIKYYWCHEDFPFPLPESPEITTQQVNDIIEKSQADIRKWETQQLRAKGDYWWKIGGAIAIIIAVAGLIKIAIG